MVLQAKGETARFLALLQAYKQAPVVTRERLYLEGVQSVLSKTHNIVVDSGHNNVMYLPINQLLQQQAKTNSNVTEMSGEKQ